MRKEKLFHLLVLLGFTLLSMTISAQTDSRDVYGWLRYDDYNQDEYGICKFKTDAADDIQPVWPYAGIRTTVFVINFEHELLELLLFVFKICCDKFLLSFI